MATNYCEKSPGELENWWDNLKQGTQLKVLTQFYPKEYFDLGYSDNLDAYWSRLNQEAQLKAYSDNTREYEADKLTKRKLGDWWDDLDKDIKFNILTYFYPETCLEDSRFSLDDCWDCLSKEDQLKSLNDYDRDTEEYEEDTE